jgi:hypothetical protein
LLRRRIDVKPIASICSRDPWGYRWAALAVAVAIAGCAAQVPRDPSSPYYRVPVGSVLRFDHKIGVPPGRTRVFFQNGTISMLFDRYAPNCNVEVRKIDYEARQYVEPGEYRVSRVQRTTEQVVEAGPLRLAALGRLVATMGGTSGSDGNPMIYEGYHLWLEGTDPNVMRLSCRGVLADPSEAYPPSIEEIRRSLGEIATLSLAEEGT